MAITTFDNLVNAMSSGQSWRSDWQKTFTGGTVVAGRWYDLSYSGGQPSVYIHGNLVSNYDFLAGTANWTFSAGFAWTAATHLMTKSGGSAETLQQDIDLVYGASYEVICTIGSYAGSGNVSISLGGGSATTHASSSTFTDTIVAGSSNNTLLFSVASTITALTIDVVYVRMLLNFTPYDGNIARNAASKDLACYTGGAVSSNVKVLTNMGAWTNVAAGAPSVLMLVDMLGCYPKIVTNSASAQPLGQNNHVANGTFTGNATSWTVGAGWAYNSNAVDKNAGGTGNLSQTTAMAAQAGRNYMVQYQITNYSVTGTLTIGFGGGTASARTITGNGTYIDFVTATGTGDLIITPTDAIRLTIDNVSCGFAPPRYGNGAGVMTYFAINTTNGANAQNFALTYANTTGTTGRGLGATVSNTASAIAQHISHSGVAAGNFGPFLPLAPGDSGISAATSALFSAASASAGFIDLVLCRPIAAIPLTAAFYAAERDLLNQLPSLPVIKDGACLSWIIFAGAVIPNPCMYQGYITTPWG